MSPVWFALWFGLALLVVYQTFVTLRVVQSATFSKHRNFWQFMFVWLLPLVGVTIAHWFVTASFSEPVAPDRKVYQPGQFRCLSRRSAPRTKG